MTVLLSITGYPSKTWLDALEKALPGRRIVTEPTGASDPGIDYAVVWKQPEGLLSTLPNLKAIFSIGAGVDHVLRDKSLPDVPIARIVAEDLTGRMSEYVAWRVLDHHRRGFAYRAQQAAGQWNERVQPAAGAVTVGIMGLGELGRDAAEKLKPFGFKLAGWSRTKKQVPGVACFAGDEELSAFLGTTDILVVLLPHTPATAGILDRALFAKLKRATPFGGPILVNAGRGGLQNEADILAALDAGTLLEASLDVFQTEPLPATSPLWHHPKVFVTPHAAASSDPDALVPLIVGQIEALERGEALKHLVDRTAGY
ncbi:MULTISPECIES: 2-hydroxyacid dehydrogenase [unclassified Aureimonas]|uniref:2-hydroxyacid dehydrogenase n=1 Tax=unclassified Aureimonas TaxID=2615206 RepID=UPI0006FCF774|nr:MULTISPECIES: glyoxylate/hydroxypyruvate reductase A [unclassified Aureimonas]KQT53868.1 glyoxylate/hydroxypyruvate reductase A [Aureimonas sp. Leaf427]KQT71690.1 glyoxylate/hydroxypyruvate reductase A [Aureimonas sp. Leaf460]